MESIYIIESEEDLIDIKPKKRQKSKVVQSLKLKFKKEESSKCKDDQDMYNETGKSIVHVTNEELNSSEMVFFCIPKAESSARNLTKKKLKADVNESIIPKECTMVNKLGSETMNFDNLDSNGKYNEIDNENSLNILNLNNVNNLSKEIKTEFNLIPSTKTIDNVSEVSKKIKIELTRQSLNSDFSENVDQIQPTVTSHIDHKNSDGTSEQIKIELVEDLDTSSIAYKEQCDNQNVPTKLPTDDSLSSNTVNDINKTLEENITIKSEVFDNLPEGYVNGQKQNNNEVEKQLINKWTIDEDKIILQTCKRVEDIEVLLETINRRIPQRSVSEVRILYTYNEN